MGRLNSIFTGVSMRRFNLFSLCLLMAVSMGLPAQVRRAEGFTRLPDGAKVAVMPMDVELFALTAGGVAEPKAEWTTKAVANLQEALRLRGAGTGGRFIAMPPSDDPILAELVHLHGAVVLAIDLHHFGTWKLPTKGEKLDWSLGEEASIIAAKGEADFALFIQFRDSYATGGRVASSVLWAMVGVAQRGGSQSGHASLVDLKTGRIVWVNRMFSATGDVRELEPAKATLQKLLQDFPG